MLVTSDPMIWTGALFTLAVFSYLYAENPAWRIAEHIYVGMTAAYTVAYQFHNTIKPTIMEDMLVDGSWGMLIPMIVGLLIYTRYFPSVSFLQRYPLSLWVGYGAGLVMAYAVPPLMTQIVGNFRTFDSFDNVVYWIATVCTLIYFFFTVKRTNPVIKYGAAIGRWAMMIAFGVSFGQTVIYRYNLFLSRMEYLLTDWLQLIEY